MSSITFPQASDDIASSSASLHDSLHSQFYAPPSFDVSGSFQMNPLSAHPPRTPRSSTSASTAASSHSRPNSSHFGSMSISVYDEKTDETETVHGYGGNKEDVAADDNEEEGLELDEEDERVKAAEKNIGFHEVWRDILATSYGRDKAFKVLQYSIRVYLLFHTRILFRNSTSAWQQALVRRLESTRAGFSFTRKMLLLFDWLTPLSIILAQKSVPYASLDSSFLANSLTDLPAKKPASLSLTSPLLSHPFFQALLAAPPPVLLDLVNGLSDDIATMSRLGLIGPKTGARAGRFADWCWFFGTLVGLVQNGIEMSIVEGQQRQGKFQGYISMMNGDGGACAVENRAYQESMAGATAKSQPKASKVDQKELARLQRKTYWLGITRTKLVMDFIFVSYDVFRLRRGKDTIQTFVGLVAAILSSCKLHDKYKSALVTKALSSTI
ncbi:hypothetical protein V8B97DRAFT_2001847 [Scleroderma yunnanense]